jgi:DNA repair exonuclease SbcCD nuclease subunit
MGNKVKCIIACSDLHIRNLRRQEEYQEQFNKFIKHCKDITAKYKKDEVRIVIAGDILHNKLDISPEAYILTSWFLRQLDKIAKTIIIAGNHDMNMNNLSRVDSLSPIFSMCSFKQVYYLDKELNYESGCLIDENIVWCLYSSFDEFRRPDIDSYRQEYPENTFFGLFHGLLASTRTDVGYIVENGLEGSYFGDIDFCIMGHVHKRQCVKYEGIPMVYCGSLIQQDHGENISGHGFITIDVESLEYEEIDISNEEHGFYTFEINSEDDIDANQENILNI